MGLFVFTGKSMKIVKLAPRFFYNNNHLVEVMDRQGNTWPTKTRGYGVVMLNINSLTFGIPLRSNTPHKNCFKFRGDQALDYTKAVLIEDDSYIGDVFLIPTDDYKSIKEKTHHIQSSFTKYVEKYIENIQKGNHSALDRAYRYTTLKNYHYQLGL